MPYIIHFFHILKLYFYLLKKQKHYKRKSIIKDEDSFIPFRTNKNKKPLWVRKKVIYLKALLPMYGCRKISIIFNKQYCNKNISISKSYVYNIMKVYHYEILHKRRSLKNNIPKKLPKNFIWNIDLTNITDIHKTKNNIFGVIDAGSRAILFLQRLKDKSTISILKSLIFSIEKYGKPTIIKSDNEIILKSKLFRFSLWILNIKHQTTQVASPWQNGKIERFFGTLKTSFNQLDFYNSKGIDKALHIFRFYYNHIRVHQHLHYLTPNEAWNNQDMTTSKNTDEIYDFSELDGVINGYYFKPK